MIRPTHLDRTDADASDPRNPENQTMWYEQVIPCDVLDCPNEVRTCGAMCETCRVECEELA